ncbi:helix-turn-helix transcriptional regulator [Kribbella sp. CA-245084]|uniref:helix-turn-helix transcriptional regulator n=1 Tax=Kribbella sp. CA-245084 TaxID=3239940 RepID=UPI003D8AEC93
MTITDRGLQLEGRQAECEALDRLVADLRAGRSTALVLRGEAGIGKTALLDYLEAHSSSCRIARASGIESEMELAFGGLHQLCTQFHSRLSDPRYQSLSTAFGLTAGTPPDRFQVGLAMLNLLAETAEDRPLICLIDDAQWLDRVSAQTLAFVARRLLAERVALVFAIREPSEPQELTGLPELLVTGLGYGDARALLDTTITGAVDERVRDRFVAETRGNPLALIELPRDLPTGQLASGLGLPDELAAKIEAGYLRRIQPLPEETRLLLLTAAAEPVGDASLLWRAAELLGIDSGAADLAESTDLIDIGARIRFRHPLIRSAVYRAASPDDQRTVHRALAAATDAVLDPDRRAWHRACATVGLDEAVATELDNAAGRAQARGGVAAAAVLLQRAAELTPDPRRRAERALTAAGTKFDAGEPDAAYDLLAAAELGPVDDLHRARLARLRARIDVARGRGREAGPMLLKAAIRLEDLHDPSARDAYLEALGAAVFAGRLGVQHGVENAAEAARAAGSTSSPSGPMELLLDGVAMRFTDGYAAAVPALKTALHSFRAAADLGDEKVVHWLWRGCPVAVELWDDDAWHELAGRGLELARGLGVLGVLPGALSYRAGVHLHAGEFGAASILVAESEAIAAATGNAPIREGRLMLAAWRGEKAAALESITIGIRDAIERGEGRALSLARLATAVLCNGLGHYEAALDAARTACAQEDLGFFGWSLAEYVEAAARSNARAEAVGALQQLQERTQAAGTDWALGILARSAALLADGPAAEALYQESIERLASTRIAVQLARTHLLYGEWLRREHRRTDAQLELRLAHDSLAHSGAMAFAERARSELAGIGETTGQHAVGSHGVLTAKEAQIAHLAATGLTNQEIGLQLFLSPHTVDWHLRKVFSKLSVTSRRQLDVTVIDAMTPVSAG